MPDRFSFDDDRDGVGSHGAVELVALVEQRGLAGVEVLRSAGVAGVGMAPTDEAEDVPVGVGDGEGDPVAEVVDQPTGVSGSYGDAGVGHFLVGDAVGAQVADQGGPAGGCVSGVNERVAGEFGPEPFGEVCLGPRPGQLGGEEVLGEPVDLDEPGAGDRTVPPRIGAREHAAQILVGLFGPTQVWAQQPSDGELLVDGELDLGGIDVVLLLRDRPAKVEVGGWQVFGRDFSVIGWPVGEGGDLTDQAEAPVHVRGRRCWTDEVVEGVAAFQGGVDEPGQGRPERALLKLLSSFCADQVGELVGPVAGGELLVGGGEGVSGEDSGDPPPQGGGGVVVGQWSRRGCGA